MPMFVFEALLWERIACVNIMTKCDYYMLVKAGVIIASHSAIRDRPENRERIIQLLGLFTKRELITVLKCEQMNKTLLDITDLKLRRRVEEFHSSLLNLYESFASEASLRVREEKFKIFLKKNTM
jgi:hypothetical protein